MSLTPEQIEQLRDRKYVDEVMRTACHILNKDFDAGCGDMEDLLDAFQNKWEKCGCITCVLQYHVVWLGHQHLLQSNLEKEECLEQLNDMYGSNDEDGPMWV